EAPLRVPLEVPAFGLLVLLFGSLELSDLGRVGNLDDAAGSTPDDLAVLGGEESRGLPAANLALHPNEGKCWE
ncbi:MAG: hypothetical protein V3V91_08925, partial [Thermoplasmata archaeon]